MSQQGKVHRLQGGDVLNVATGGQIAANGTQASAITDLTVTGTYATDDSNIETVIVA